MDGKRFNPLKHIIVNTKFFGLRYLIFNTPYQLLKAVSSNKEPFGGQDKVRAVNSYKMVLKDIGTGIHSDLLNEGKREPFATKILEKSTLPGEIVLEAGANIGYYTILQSKKVGPRGKIYAIEPEKENFEYLKKNIKLNNLKNVSSFKEALGNKNGTLEIYTYEQGNLNSPIKWGESYVGKENVKVSKLDDFLKGKRIPNWIRMDVEGYEYEILLGAKKTLKNGSLKKLFIEFHFGMLEKEKMVLLLKLLKESGFEIDVAIVEDKSISECKGQFKKAKEFFYKKRRKYKVLDKISLDEICNNKDILEGHLGAFEIFLSKRKNPVDVNKEQRTKIRIQRK